jgi:hypothetical protein
MNAHFADADRMGGTNIMFHNLEPLRKAVPFVVSGERVARIAPRLRRNLPTAKQLEYAT